MKKFNVIGWMLFIAIVAMGAKVTDNALRIGDKTGSDVEIQMGSGRLKWDQATSKMKFSNDAGLSIKDIGSGGGGGGGVNVAKNADLESGNPPFNYTASGGTLVAETISPLFGAQSGRWDASATAQTLTLDLSDVLTNGFTSQKCQAEFYYTWAGNPGDITAEIKNSTTTIVSAIDLPVTVSGDAVLFQFPTFDCPSAGEKLQIVWTSTAAAAPLIWDNVFLGTGRNSLQLSQTILAASAHYAHTASCNWLRNSATFGDFTAEVNCPAITVNSSSFPVNTTDDDLPDIVFDNLPAGTYVGKAVFQANQTVAEAHTKGFRVSDGTSVGQECGNNYLATTNGNSIQNFTCTFSFTYSSSGARTFKLTGYENGTGSVQVDNANSGNELSWTVWKVPGANAQALTLETAGEHWDVNIGGANVDLSNSTIASYTAVASSALDLVVNTGSKSAQIPCSGNNPSTGLTCSVGNEEPGIVIDIATAGRYRVCGEFSHVTGADAAGTAQVIFEWIETPNNAETILQEGNSRISSTADNIGATAINGHMPINLCGDFIFSSAGQKTIRLMREQVIVATVSSNLILSDRNAAQGQRDIHITVDKMDQQMPTPVFTDLTNSLNSKIENYDTSATYITCVLTTNDSAGTPVVTEDTNCVTSLTDNGVGNIGVNFSVTFGSTPYCLCNPRSNGGLNTCTAQNPSTTGVSIFTRLASSGAAADIATTLICIGKK